jgi:protein gp37
VPTPRPTANPAPWRLSTTGRTALRTIPNGLSRRPRLDVWVVCAGARRALSLSPTICLASTASRVSGGCSTSWSPMASVWTTASRVYNSMSDLFHEVVPDAFVHEMFDKMAEAKWHSYQILTKRPQRMAAVVGAYYAQRPGTQPLPHVWLGTSIENDRWTGRADALRATPAAVRFISAEPLLGPLPSLDLAAIDWLIVGGESGAGARPVKPEWARDLRDRALGADVPFFFKQWGGRTPNAHGRPLDGLTWEEYPRPLSDPGPAEPRPQSSAHSGSGRPKRALLASLSRT